MRVIILIGTLLLGAAGLARAEVITIAVDGEGDAARDLLGRLGHAVETAVGPADAGEVVRDPGGPRVARNGKPPARWVLVVLRPLSRAAIGYRVRVAGPRGDFVRGGIATPGTIAHRAIADVMMGLLVRSSRSAPRRVAVVPATGRATPLPRAWSDALQGRGFELVGDEEVRAAQREAPDGHDASHFQALRELVVAEAVVVIETLSRGRDRTIVSATVHDAGPVRGVATSTSPVGASDAVTDLLLQAPMAKGARR